MMDVSDADAVVATGLQPHDPPDDVHAMDRGPRAVAQALEIADLIIELVAEAGRELQKTRPRGVLLLTTHGANSLGLPE